MGDSDTYDPNLPLNRASISSVGEIDIKNVLALSETEKEMGQFIDYLTGLIRSSQKGVSQVVRAKKPIFTYEFTFELVQGIYFQVNRITARSTFTHEQIQKYNYLYTVALSKRLASAGMLNLISDSAWDKIVQYKNDDVWKTKYKHDWDYNKNVNKDMLDIVKKDFNLVEESFGQDIILHEILLSVIYFIDAGRSRAKEALTLDHEKTIYKETFSQTPPVAGRAKDGFFTKLKRGLTRF